MRGDFQRGAEKFLPLCVRVRRDSDFLDDKIGIDRSAAVMDTPIVRLNFLSLRRVMMQCIKNVRLATQGIAAVLLLGIAFAAGAEQMMRALPAPAVQSTAVVAPAGMPPVAKPPNSNATMSPKNLLPTIPGGGMAQLTPAAACGMNPAPRITSINGRSSGGIVFKPGDSLNIAGCGFGKGGQVALTDVAPLYIDGWDDTNIKAHIDPALSRVHDVNSGVKLYVKPNGAAEMLSQVVHSFKAVYTETVIQLAAPELGVFSNIYGAPKAFFNGTTSRVSRNLKKDGFCPPVTNQVSQMSDFFRVEIYEDALPNGVITFDAPAGSGPEYDVNYTNETDQTNWDTQAQQMVLVGDGGRVSKKSPGGFSVTFQGHSTYVKKGFLGASGGTSTCTSSYTISLTVKTPRGFKPWAKVRLVSGGTGGM